MEGSRAEWEDRKSGERRQKDGEGENKWRDADSSVGAERKSDSERLKVKGQVFSSPS